MNAKQASEEVPIINQLREEYFDRLPEICRVKERLETEIRYFTRNILKDLKSFEQLVIKSRVKDCESAIKTLRRKKGVGGTFDPETPSRYVLLDLPDLAAVRALVFPRSRLNEVDVELRKHFANWTPDPVEIADGQLKAPKYFGRCTDVSPVIQAEYQVVPMLIGLYWQVEHAAIYKPPPLVRVQAGADPLHVLNTRVESALLNFEEEYEKYVLEASNDISSGM